MKLKKGFVLLACASLLSGCGDKVSEEKKTQVDAWNMIVESLEKLNTHDNIVVYDLIGTLNSVHDDYSSEEKNGKKIMKYYKAGYNYFLQKTNIDNSQNEVTYTSTYGSIGECTSEGNKFIRIQYEDDDYSIIPEKRMKEYDLTYENINKYLYPMYEKMKQGKFEEYEKYIIKDGKATAYVDGKKRYENKDFSSFQYVQDAMQKESYFPPIYARYLKSPIQNIIDQIDKIDYEDEENDEYNALEYPNDFSYQWIDTLHPADRTLHGTEIISKELCKVDINKEEEKTLIRYTLDKDSQAYKDYFKGIEEQAKNYDLSWEALSYFDDAYIDIEIDKNGCMSKIEFNYTMAYINEGIEGFKVPQYIVIEFEYK